MPYIFQYEMASHPVHPTAEIMNEAIYDYNRFKRHFPIFVKIHPQADEVFMFMHFRCFATAVLELSHRLGVPAGVLERRLRHAELSDLSRRARREIDRLNRRQKTT